MSLASILNTWMRGSNNRRRKLKPDRNRRLGVETLEQRVVLDLGLSEAAHYASGLYFDLLNRQPGQAEVSGWVSLLTHGFTPLQVAQGFVESPEYRSNLIARDYRTLLGREPEPFGFNNWLAAMQQGLLAQQVLAGFLNSNEYYTNHGGTNAGWVTGLYHDLLNRSPDPAGLNVWLQFMQSGLSRPAVTYDIEYGEEAFIVDVTSAYHNILGRSAGPTEIDGWVNVLAHGLDFEGLAAAFASSPEYIAQQQGVDFPLLANHSTPLLPQVTRPLFPSTGGLGLGGALPANGALGVSLNGDTGVTGLGSAPANATGNQPTAPTAAAQIQLVNNQWVPIGPAPINGSQVPGMGPSTGRIDGIAADPTNPNIIYVAAAGGGVWKTTDGGTTWTPLTDDQPTTTMGAIAVAQSNPSVIYAGTGEADNATDSFYGLGILSSSDGGATWNNLGADVFRQKAITKIAIDPTNANTVYAAVSDGSVNGALGNDGIWRSTDGGITWTNMTASITTSLPYTDVVIAIPPTSTTQATLYMAIGSAGGGAQNGVYKSTDGGMTWNLAGNFPVANAGVIRIAVAASSPTTIYAAVTSANTQGLLGMEKSTDGGVTWTRLSNTPDYLTTPMGGGPQGFYDSTLAVDPNDPNKVYAGGAGGFDPTLGFIGSRFVASLDGGNTWFEPNGISQHNGPHADHHAIAFDASGRVLVGTDGGIWRLDSLTNMVPVWTNLNGNLNITQFTDVALDPTNPSVAFGGSQDNGTEKFTGSLPWTWVDSGDGRFVGVDPINSQTVYHTFPFIGSEKSSFFQRSDNGGIPINGQSSWMAKDTGISPMDGDNFTPPIVVDPSSGRLLVGTNRIYESTNHGDTWTPLVTLGQNGWTSIDPIVSIGTETGDPNTIYATTFGPAGRGRIFVTTTHGRTWTESFLPLSPTSAPGLFPDIIVDPSNNMTAYVVQGRFTNTNDSTPAHIFKTTNAGMTWTDITGGLPNLPVNAIVIDKRAAHLGSLYIGRDDGVFVGVPTASGTYQWTRLGPLSGTGMLPDVRVTSLELDQTHDILAAGTYGRGMWEFTYNGGYAPTPPGLSINDVSGPRPATGMVPFNFTVTLSPSSSQSVTVNFATQNVTAVAGVDYVAASGTLMFNPGDTTKTITVEVIGSGDINTKVFDVNLSNAVGAPIVRGTGMGTILGRGASLSIADVTGARPASGSVPFNFTVTLGQPLPAAVTVNFATQNNTAIAGVDYVATSGTLTFMPGETSKTIPVQVLGSTNPNTTTFFVNLSSPTNATILKGQGVGTILGFNVAPPPDRFEPNDTSDTATNFGVLPAGTDTSGNLSIFDHPNGFHDVDWYRWTAGQAGTFSVQINYTIFSGTDLHLRLFVLDSSGVLHQLASSRNMNTTTQMVSVGVAPGEQLFAWIYGFSGSQGTYQMTVSLG
jgi:hypothetical protein